MDSIGDDDTDGLKVVERATKRRYATFTLDELTHFTESLLMQATRDAAVYQKGSISESDSDSNSSSASDADSELE